MKKDYYSKQIDELAEKLRKSINERKPENDDEKDRLDKERKSVDEIVELSDICDEVMGLAKAVARVAAGESGRMYKDAILRMVDGLTEAKMLLGEALYNQYASYYQGDEKDHFNRQGRRLIYAGYLMDPIGNLIRDIGNFFLNVGQLLMSVRKYMKLHIPVINVDVPILALYFVYKAGDIICKIAQKFLNIALSVFSVGVNLKVAGENSLHLADDAGYLSDTHHHWKDWDKYCAAQKIHRVVEATLAWAEEVIAVEPVPELPIPICGWDIDDPYAFFGGAETPEIVDLPPDVIEGNMDASEIVQGVNFAPYEKDIEELEKIESY